MTAAAAKLAGGQHDLWGPERNLIHVTRPGGYSFDQATGARPCLRTR